MTGFSWLEPGLIGGMGDPWRGDDRHLDLTLAELARKGVGAVVSVTGCALPPEVVQRHELRYLHLPVADMEAPDLEQLSRFVEFVRRCHRDGLGVAVHCGAGLGRTGTLLAAYLVSRRHPAEDAMHLVRQLRPGSIETAGQEESVRSFAAEIG